MDEAVYVSHLFLLNMDGRQANVVFGIIDEVRHE